jgi:pre-mRNA-processing factor 40
MLTSSTLSHSKFYRDSFVASLEESGVDSRFDTSKDMSDSDRQLYFADFVIELQAAEDDARRRIRDARRRAEKAQREAYRDVLRRMATERRILPSTRWRNIEELIATDNSFSLVHSQERDAPRELFEEFVDEWDVNYRRDRSLLSRLLHPSPQAEIVVKASTSYAEFTKLLLEKAAYSPELYGDTRRIINRDEPVSSARLYFDELILRAKGVASTVANRSGSAASRQGDESSEDEGEIKEEGELPEDGENAQAGGPNANPDVSPESESSSGLASEAQNDQPESSGANSPPNEDSENGQQESPEAPAESNPSADEPQASEKPEDDI